MLLAACQTLEETQGTGRTTSLASDAPYFTLENPRARPRFETFWKSPGSQRSAFSEVVKCCGLLEGGLLFASMGVYVSKSNIYTWLLPTSIH